MSWHSTPLHFFSLHLLSAAELFSKAFFYSGSSQRGSPLGVCVRYQKLVRNIASIVFYGLADGI